jgi:hypothetical protein
MDVWFSTGLEELDEVGNHIVGLRKKKVCTKECM